MWFSALPQVLAVLAVLYVPGYLIFRAAGLRAVLSVAAAPAASSALVGASAVVLAFVHLPLNLPSIAVITLAVAGITRFIAVRCHQQPKFFHSDLRDFWRTHALREYLPEFFMILATIIALIIPYWFVNNPFFPLQNWDSMFHYNAVSLVESTHESSFLGSLTPLYGLNTTAVLYPAGWHALVSLAATPATVVPTVNAFAMLDALVWTLGMWALALALGFNFQHRLSTLLMVILMLHFPTFLHTISPPLPYVFMVSALPGFLALVAHAVKSTPGWRKSHPFFAVFVWIGITLILGAGTLTYPGIITTTGLLLLVPVCWGLFRLWKRMSHQQRLIASLTLLIVILAAVVSLYLVDTARERLLAMFTAYRFKPTPFNSFMLMKTLTSYTSINWTYGRNTAILTFGIQIIVAFFALVGIAKIFWDRKNRWIVFSWLLVSAVVLTSMLHTGPLMWLAGLWYTSTYRIMAFQLIPLGLIGATAMVWLYNGIVSPTVKPSRFISPVLTRLQQSVAKLRVSLALPFRKGSVRVTCVCVGVALVCALTAVPRSAMVARTLPGHEKKTPALSLRELEMISQLDKVIPEDALVLGNPNNGSAYIQAVARRRVVFPQMYVRESDWEERYLAKNFDRINEDKTVCEILNRYNIRYFYDDSSSGDYGDKALDMPGLSRVDTSTGFNQIAQGGTATVFEITACD